jgi:PAS domain S-box-containing protein
METIEDNCPAGDCRCSEYLETLFQKIRKLREKIANDQQICSRIKESDEWFQRIFDYAPFGAAMTDSAGRILRANKAMCTMLGYGQDELRTKHFIEITHSNDRDTDLELFEKLREGAIEYCRIDKRYISKAGKTVWGSLAVTLIQESRSDSYTVIGMIENISAKKKLRGISRLATKILKPWSGKELPNLFSS